MLTKTLVGRHKLDFDLCILPAGAKFIGAPYTIQEVSNEKWFQKIEYPDPKPLPKPHFLQEK